MAKEDTDQPHGERDRGMEEQTDDSAFGKGEERVRSIADEESDEFGDMEDLEEEEDEDV